jgi:CheY-like chemotaxis protein
VTLQQGTRGARSASTTGPLQSPRLASRTVADAAAAANVLLLWADTGVIAGSSTLQHSGINSGGGGTAPGTRGGPSAPGVARRSSVIHDKATRGGFGLPLARMISANIGAEARVYDVHGHSLEEVAAARPGDVLLADASPNAGGPCVTVFELRVPRWPAVEPSASLSPTLAMGSAGTGGSGCITRASSDNSVAFDRADTTACVGSANPGAVGVAAAVAQTRASASHTSLSVPAPSAIPQPEPAAPMALMAAASLLPSPMPDVTVAIFGGLAPPSPTGGSSSTGNPLIWLPGINSSTASDCGDGDDGGGSSTFSMAGSSVASSPTLDAPRGASSLAGASTGSVTRVAALPSLVASAASSSALNDVAAPAGTTTRTRLSSASLHATAAPSLHATAAAPPQRSLGLRVLHADDESVNRKLMGKMLARLGCEVTAVEDGDEVEPALAAVECGTDAGGGAGATMAGRPYDVVLLDIVMKRVSGDVVCRRLVHGGCGGVCGDGASAASSGSGRLLLPLGVPVIAVTGNARDYDELRRAGFTDVIEKPFTAEKLQAVLGRHVPALRNSSTSGGGSAAPYRVGGE